MRMRMKSCRYGSNYIQQFWRNNWTPPSIIHSLISYADNKKTFFCCIITNLQIICSNKTHALVFNGLPFLWSVWSRSQRADMSTCLSDTELNNGPPTFCILPLGTLLCRSSHRGNEWRTSPTAADVSRLAKRCLSWSVFSHQSWTLFMDTWLEL